MTLSAAAACTAAVTATALLPSVASADPGNRIAGVEAQLGALERQAAVAAESFHAATDRLGEVERRLAEVQAQVAAQQQALTTVQGEASGLAAASYRNAGIDPAFQLIFADDPASFLAQVSSIEALSDRQRSVIGKVTAVREQLSRDRLAVAQQVGQLEELQERRAAERATIDRKVEESERLLESLEEEERRRLEAERRAAAERAAREAAAARAAVQAAAAERAQDERSSRSRTRTDDDEADAAEPAPAESAGSGSSAGSSSAGSSDSGRSDSGSPSAGSGGAAGAVETALAQVGKSYRYAANGPSAFDCSGLTTYAWRSAGVSLPRSSSAQYAAGRKVSRSELRPGDLVYYYSPISHVGIYIGGGKIVHAANPRSGVNITGVSSMPFAGATRP